MAFLRKRNKTYHIIDYNSRTGKRNEFSIRESNPAIAKGMLKTYNAKRTLDQLPQFLRDTQKQEELTLQEALKKFTAEKKLNDSAAKTVRAYQTAVDNFIKITGNKPVSKISMVDYNNYLIWFKNNKCVKTKREYSKVTVTNYTRHLYLFFAWLQKNKFVEENYFPKVKRSAGNPHPIPPGDLQKILNKLLEKEMTEPSRAEVRRKQYNFVMLTYLCAMRKGEVINAHVEDFNLKQKVVYIRNKKGNRTDIIPMLDDIESFILQLQSKKELPASGKIFDYVSIDGPKTFWNTLKKELFLSHRFHALRSARISDLANLGIEPLFLQRFARHNDIATTLLFYTLIDIEMQRTAMNKRLPAAIVLPQFERPLEHIRTDLEGMKKATGNKKGVKQNKNTV